MVQSLRFESFFPDFGDHIMRSKLYLKLYFEILSRLESNNRLETEWLEALIG